MGWESGLPLPVEADTSATIADLMTALADAASRAQTLEQMRIELGKLALDAHTVAEGDFAGEAGVRQAAAEADQLLAIWTALSARQES